MKKSIVMLGTAFDTKGGISAVVGVYRAWGLFSRWPIVYLATHRDGSASTKAMAAAKALGQFAALLLSFRVGLVHIHASSRASFWRKSVFILLAFLFRRPVLFHLHSGGFLKFSQQEVGRFRRAFITWILDRVDVIIALSPEWERNIRKISANPNVVVLSNPVLVKPLNGKGGLDKVRGQLLFLGRLGQGKGSYDLLEAIALVRSRYPEVKLLCGGDGEAELVLKRASELGIEDRICLLGWVNGTEKETLLASSVAYVLPSYGEGQPMGVLEAMAAGLPVISTYVGGIPNVITNGREGFLIRPGDVAALVEAISKILEDDSLRARLGSAAYSRVTTSFSADRSLPLLEGIYRRFSSVRG